MGDARFNQACHRGDLDQVGAIFSFYEANIKPKQTSEERTWENLVYYGMCAAIESDQRAVIAWLLSHGVAITQAMFFCAASNGSITAFQEFIRNGMDINTTEFNGQPAVRMAVREGPLLRWLLDHGADPNLKDPSGYTPLCTAFCQPFDQATSTIDILLSYGAQMEPDILHQLMRGVKRDREVEMIRFLVARGARLDFDHEGYGPPLHYAAILGALLDVEVLLDLGADPDLVISGETPATLAKGAGHMDIYELLMRKSKTGNPGLDF